MVAATVGLLLLKLFLTAEQSDDAVFLPASDSPVSDPANSNNNNTEGELLAPRMVNVKALLRLNTEGARILSSPTLTCWYYDV